MNGLIIFIKNPVLGKAKTRLAATIGDEKALKVYQFLLTHTRKNTEKVDVTRFLFYSNDVDKTDEWSNDLFQKELQNPTTDLGEKMMDAFERVQTKGIQKAMIIGSDCYDLTSEILSEGFISLEKNHAVLGKAFDGGYYTIGLNFKKIGKELPSVLKNLFSNKNWSHKDVSKEAIEVFEKNQLSFSLLPTLSDIDNESDLKGELITLIS